MAVLHTPRQQKALGYTWALTEWTAQSYGYTLHDNKKHTLNHSRSELLKAMATHSQTTRDNRCHSHSEIVEAVGLQLKEVTILTGLFGKSLSVCSDIAKLLKLNLFLDRFRKLEMYDYDHELSYFSMVVWARNILGVLSVNKLEQEKEGQMRETK